MKTGSITIYGKLEVPSGYLLCDGASYLRADYPNLFAIIGTVFGSADGTHFNVPDLRGRAIFGKSTDSAFDTLGKTGGNKTISTAHTHTMATHNHTMTSSSSTAAATFQNDGGSQTTAAPPHSHTAATCTIGNQSDAGTNSGGSASVSIMNPFIVFYPLIKT